MTLLTIGTGVGGAIVADERLLRGGFGAAGEIGHLRVVPGGLPCGCGQRGCIEQYGSGRALLRMANEIADAGGIGQTLAEVRAASTASSPVPWSRNSSTTDDPGAHRCPARTRRLARTGLCLDRRRARPRGVRVRGRGRLRRRATARPDPRGVSRPPAGPRVPSGARGSRLPSWSTTPGSWVRPTWPAARTAEPRRRIGAGLDSAARRSACSTGSSRTSSSGRSSCRCSGRGSRGARTSPRPAPVIFASNHLSFIDSVFLPLAVDRQISFLAKSEYFTGKGFKGWFTKKFFLGIGQLPIDRSGGKASEASLNTRPRVSRQRRPARHLPRGHPQPRRPPLSRPHRRRPHDPRVRARR